jgi:hypothetical protein
MTVRVGARPTPKTCEIGTQLASCEASPFRYGSHDISRDAIRLEARIRVVGFSLGFPEG